MRRATLALTLAGLLAAGCGREGDAGPCDDRVRLRGPVPAATKARMAAQGITDVVGAGDVWFVAPAAERWSALVDGDRAKVALWVDRDGPLPPVVVRRIGHDDRGEAASDLTAEGLPGPVPTSVSFPVAGCWEVVATGSSGVARIVVEVD